MFAVSAHAHSLKLSDFLTLLSYRADEEAVDVAKECISFSDSSTHLLVSVLV